MISYYGARACAVPIAVFAVCGCAAGVPTPAQSDAAPEVVRDLSGAFQPLSAEGAFVAFDSAANQLIVHEPERAGRGFLPASTFKILNSLIALETGVLTDERQVIAWDSVDRGDWWNGDMDMARAFERSAVWFYQEVARRIGEDRMRYWIQRVGYGNADMDGGIDQFWLEGDLRISARQQVEFLRRLRAGELPFSERSQSIVRRVMRMEAADGFVLSGKTGWARLEGAHYGWLVGWVEQPHNVCYFATQIESRDPAFPMRRAQQEISRAALRSIGCMP